VCVNAEDAFMIILAVLSPLPPWTLLERNPIIGFLSNARFAHCLSSNEHLAMNLYRFHCGLGFAPPSKKGGFVGGFGKDGR
jgi:hypothetical protein